MKQILLKLRPWYLMIMLLMASTVSWSQARTVTGTVTDSETNESLPGASVVVKGTTKGVSTDINGKFSISISPTDKVLLVTYIGYDSKEVEIGAQNMLSITLTPKRTNLEEVVVVGYGTAKVKDLTSQITTVKGDELSKTPASQPMQAMQGKVAGLQVIASGSPGASSKIIIRGQGAFPGVSGENPLYVVDGMFYDNIDFLNPSDIKSISVLKDASALAIYGVKAASGVVLIETFSGNYEQNTEITYDGYAGYQIAQNVVKMANAEQFTTMAIESGSAADASFILNSMQRYGRSRVNPNVPDVNTDWYKEILRPAFITNQNINLNGGTSKAKYSLGANYFKQEGLMDMLNQYERFNLRSKIDIQANKWLTVGANFILSNATKYQEQAGAWNLAYFAVPILPVYDDLNTGATPTNYANAQDLGYRSGQNPFPTMDFNEDKLKINKLLTVFYAEFSILPKTLTFKSTYNNSISYIDQRVINLPYFIGNSFQNPDSKIQRIKSAYTDHMWDNILTYTKQFEKHNLTVMAGTSYRDEGYQMLQAQGVDFPTDLEQSWYIAQSTSKPEAGVSDDGFRQYGMSYFGRLSYNYNNKYILYTTMRADGSSKYQEKFGYFPTVGAAWVLSEEKFLKGNKNIDFLKLRASWGQLGNNYVSSTAGQLTSTVWTTTLGGVIYSGTVAGSTFSSLKWELVEETNIGLTATFLKERLTLDADYFIKITKNAALPVAVPGTRDIIIKNAGEIKNTGVEVVLGWKDQISKDLSYFISTNVSTLKNQVTDLYGQLYLDGGMAEFRQRNAVGEALNAFYGYEIEGVYQTQNEVDHDPVAVANELEPGDFKYKDLNEDGKINDDDRTFIGSIFPSLIYGASLGLTYKNFDFTTNLYGQNGNSVLNRKRGEVIWTADQNMDADLAVNRWHGEGTTNEYPSSKGLRKGWNQKMSTFYVEDGSFFRIQNVQIGYNIKGKKLFGADFPDTKITFTADRPYTAFSYNGFTPELATGIDSQTYPLPSTYSVGLNIKF